jgi:hypothetical protein
MAIVIPEANRWFGQGVFVAQDAQRRRREDEMACIPGGQVQPTRCQHAEKMAVAEDQDMAANRPQSADYAVGASGFVLKRSVASGLVPAVQTVFQGRLYVSPAVRE